MNKAMVIGNLGNDPEVRYTRDGIAVATFSLATTERWKDGQGERHEETGWHRIVVWRGLAEVCREHLKKGMKVYIEGKIRTRKWEDQSGVTRYTTEIIARDLEMLGGRESTPATAAPEEDTPPLPDEVPF